MLTLHLEIFEGQAATSAALPREAARVPLPRTAAAFRGERSVGVEGNLVQLVGDELLEAVCEVVWFKDEVRLEGECVIPSMRNLLMFLSDVRTRRFKTGVFLGDDVLAAAERKWQPTPMFLPGESQGRGSLVGCCLWDRTEAGHD